MRGRSRGWRGARTVEIEIHHKRHLRRQPTSEHSGTGNQYGRRRIVHAKGDGSGAPAAGLDDEIHSAQDRFEAEEAAWFVAVDGDEKVGMVFGELEGHEVHVRIWIHPDYRHRGYGTAALAKSRPEMAAYFPAVPLVIRAPGATLV